MEADDIDRRILAGLLANGRATTDELGDVADVEDTTAAWHKEVLEAVDVITGYEPRIDYELLGYELTAVFRIGVETTARDSVTELLASWPHLHTVYEVADAHDLVAIGRFTDDGALEATRQKLRSADGVGTVSVDLATPHTEFEWFTPE